MSLKNPNPDEIYQQKAMLEPAAPVTLWLFPELKLLANTMQRSALANASRIARHHWISRILRFSLLPLALLGIWLIEVKPRDYRAPLHYVALLVLLASFLFNYLRTRAELRAAATSAERADA